jgi:LPXTG-motif cell wall-anchored protein
VAKTLGSGESSVPLAGTNLPLYGLMGICLLAVGMGMMLYRRRTA